MKKIIMASMLIMLMLLTACAAKPDTAASTPQPTESVQETEPESAPEAQPEVASETAPTEHPGPEHGAEEEAEENGRVLVVYFSATGTTKKIAEAAGELLGADMYEIVPKEPYSAADLNYNSDCRANREQNDASARPEISEPTADVGAYDTVLLGYPIWWGRAPRIIYTFLEQNDLSGKTVVPFCTSGSSSFNDEGIRDIPDEGTVWMQGRRFGAGASEEDVRQWLDELGLFN